MGLLRPHFRPVLPGFVGKSKSKELLGSDPLLGALY